MPHRYRASSPNEVTCHAFNAWAVSWQKVSEIGPREQIIDVAISTWANPWLHLEPWFWRQPSSLTQRKLKIMEQVTTSQVTEAPTPSLALRGLVTGPRQVRARISPKFSTFLSTASQSTKFVITKFSAGIFGNFGSEKEIS